MAYFYIQHDNLDQHVLLTAVTMFGDRQNVNVDCVIGLRVQMLNLTLLRLPDFLNVNLILMLS